MGILDTCDKVSQAIHRVHMLRHIGEGVLKEHRSLGNALCLLATDLETDLEAAADALSVMQEAM